MFTGDRSGDWLFGSMFRAGFANQPHSVHADDGLELRGAFVGAAVRCAPPANKPLPVERDNCLPYAAAELGLIRPAVIVCLGKFAWDAACLLHELKPRPAFGHLAEFAVRDGPVLLRPAFGHLAEFRLPDGPVLLGSFHPSQQNTFTGRLTEPMLDAVFERAAQIAGDGVMVPRARNP